MISNSLLVAGAVFLVVLSIGQLLVQNRNSSNILLFVLLSVCSLWVLHAFLFRYGTFEQYPHLHKVYLPLLCLTGSLWYAYTVSLHKTDSNFKYSAYHLIPVAICFLLSLPFFLQDADYKRNYIEIDLIGIPSVMMYMATRLAEFTLVFYFIKTLLFLRKYVNFKNSKTLGVSELLAILSITALLASILRTIGATTGKMTVSVLIPTSMTLLVFLSLHFASYRIPAVLALRKSNRKIIPAADKQESLEKYSQHIRSEELYLDANLKIDRVARKVGVPIREISQAINDADMNFNEYINKFRIEHAKDLLVKDAKMTILDVMMNSGFNNKGVFYTHFKSSTGMAPGAYRKKLTTKSNPVPEQQSVKE